MGRSARWSIAALSAILLVTGMLGTAPAGAALQAPVIQAPASGSSHPANPELRWSAVVGAAGYRVQVAVSATFSPVIYQLDTTVTRHIPTLDLDAGTLHWRVAALSGGIPQAWASGSFVKLATLGTPAPLSPADGATTAYPAATVLSWTPVAAAGAYDVHITGSSTINDQPIRIPTTSISVQLADEPITWRVRAVSTNDRTVGPWSATRAVDASWDGVPAIQSPPDGGFPIRDAWLAWDPLPGAKQYEVDITPLPADWASGRTVRITTDLPAHRFLDPNVAGGGEYAWRVRGIAADGMATAWTAIRTFEIELSQPPDLLAPTDGSVQAGYPVLRWTPVRRASHYLVDVSTDATFATGVASIRTTEPELVASVSSPVPLDLASGQTYFWRVRPIDDPGGKMASEPSATRSFTYSPPEIVQLAPANQEFVTVPTLSWAAGYGARYRLTIRHGSEVIYVAETRATTHTPTTLLPTGGLGWRVEALTWAGEVVNASDWRTVVVQALEATESEPMLTLPDGATDWVPSTITWTPVIDAAWYDVRFPCSPPTCGSLNAEPLVYPAFTFDRESFGRQRFDYEVVAYDADGTELAISETRHFVWTNPPLAEVLPVAGCAEPCAVSDTPLLSWQPVDRAGWYWVSIFRQGDPIAHADYATYATSFRPTADLPDGAFTWRIRACAYWRCSQQPPGALEEGSLTKTTPAPVLADPEDGFEFVDLVVLSWEDWLEAPGADGHASEAVGYGGWGTGGSDSLMTVFMTNSPSIEWEVQASFDIGSGHGGLSPRSERRTATIRRPAPVIAGPANASDHELMPMLSWLPRALARSYEVELYRGDGTDLSAGALVRRTAAHPRTAWIGNEYGAGTYAWRVRADLGFAGTSDWSPVRTFTVRSEPVALLGPSGGASLQQSALTLSWETIDRAEAYRVELSQSATFAAGVTSVVTSQARWIPPSTLAAGTWHWRVTPLSASAAALGPSSSRSFTILSPPTPPPSITPAPTPTPTPTPTSTPAPTAGSVTRQSGANRYATAAAVSKATYPAGSVPVAFVASGLNFPDALAGAAAAGRLGGPLLLVTSSSIPPETAAELNRLKPARIVVLGGTGVVSAGVASQLDAFTSGSVTRQSGANRYATAAAVSKATYPAGNVPVAFVASGLNFPDALAGAAAAGRLGGPLLLVSPTAIPTDTARELDRLNPARIVVLGGSAVVSSAVAGQLDAFTTGSVTRQSGANRYATAAAVSRATYPAAGVPVAFVASGLNFPDALAGAAAAGRLGGPLLLVTSSSIPPETAAELNRLKPARIVVLGGTGVVSSGVAGQLDAYLAR